MMNQKLRPESKAYVHQSVHKVCFLPEIASLLQTFDLTVPCLNSYWKQAQLIRSSTESYMMNKIS